MTSDRYIWEHEYRIKMMETAAAKILKSKEASLKFLIDAGIVDKDTKKLSDDYK